MRFNIQQHKYWNNTLLLIFIIIFLMTYTLACTAKVQQGPSSKKITSKSDDECVDLIRQRTAAFVASDWQNVDRMSVEFITYCDGVLGKDQLASAYENIAIANIEMGKPKEALNAAESCIKINYSEPGCHFAKARAFLQLGNIVEMRRSLDISEKLAQHRIEISNSKMKYADTEGNMLVLKSEVKKCESMLYAITALKKYFESVLSQRFI